MISYEGEIDTVILTHCRYSLRFGKGQQVQYDFGALEKHIYDRFLVGKPGIDGTSQPVMVYSGDVIQQDVFEQLKKNIKPQVIYLHGVNVISIGTLCQSILYKLYKISMELKYVHYSLCSISYKIKEKNIKHNIN